MAFGTCFDRGSSGPRAVWRVLQLDVGGVWIAGCGLEDCAFILIGWRGSSGGSLSMGVFAEFANTSLEALGDAFGLEGGLRRLEPASGKSDAAGPLSHKTRAAVSVERFFS